MKAHLIFFLLFTLSMFYCFGQPVSKRLPVIDMHLHVYSAKSYWGGADFKLKDTVLSSPKNNVEHIKAVLEQIEKYNIVITYASGNFEALDSINKQYPGKFLPSFEIYPTKELLKDEALLNKLKLKIKNGEIRGIGEVANFYTGVAPNNPVLDTLYRIAEEYNLPIGLHFAPGPPGSQLGNYPNMQLEYSNPLLLQDVLIRFPKLRMNIMHAGLPIYQDEAFGMLFMFPDLYVDISCLAWYGDYTRESLKDFLVKAIRYGFGNRIMYGSDEMVWPGTIGISIDYINNANFLTEKQKRDILYNNAVRFLRLPEEEIRKHHQ
jgi:uncharacterized protein